MLDTNSIEIYSSRDKLRSFLIDMAKDYLEVDTLDFNKLSYMSYILDINSVLASNLMFYNTSVYREFFLTKAIQKESVINLASFLGYDAKLAEPATCNVFFEVDFSHISYSFPTNSINLVMYGLNDSSSDVYTVSSRDGIQFSLLDTVILSLVKSGGSMSGETIKIDENYYNIGLQQDTSSKVTNLPYRVINNKVQFFLNFSQVFNRTETFSVPVLKPYEFYSINVPIDSSYYLSDINVSVKSENSSAYEEWNNYTSIFTIPAGTKGFVYKITDSGIKIMFGNGVIGAQPSRYSTIQVNVKLTNGYKGNVIGGSIVKSSPFTFIDTITGKPLSYNGVSPVVLNKTPGIGGKDIESIDEIRYNAMARVSMNNRVVSPSDFANIDLLKVNLPVQDIISILKRSDIAKNNISIFSSLIYENDIIPTKNGVLKIDSSTLVEGDNKFPSLRSFTYDNSEDEAFITMFDLNIIKNIGVSNTPFYNCYYSYTIKDLTTSPVLEENIQRTDKYYDPLIMLIPTSVKLQMIEVNTVKKIQFTLTLTNLSHKLYGRNIDYKKYLNLYVDGDFTKPGAISNQPFNFTNVNINGITMDTATGNAQQIVSQFTVDLDNIQSGNRKMIFTIRRDLVNEINENRSIISAALNSSDTSTNAPYIFFNDKMNLDLEDLPNGVFMNRSSSSTIIKNDLGSMMSSSVIEKDDGYVYVYDCPLILKSYYDQILSTVKSDFEFSIFQTIAGFDIKDYKMMSDNVNLKIANTHATSRNMKYNKKTKFDVNDLLNVTLDSTQFEDNFDSYEEGYRIAFLGWDPLNHWYNDTNLTNRKRVDGWIAQKSTGGWIFELLTPNDIFNINSVNDSSNSGVYIFTGNEIIKPEFNIPINIKVSILRDPSFSGSDSAIIFNIKNNLIDGLYSKFGYDKNLFRSDIIKIIQSTPGVLNCSLIEPRFDIFFSYNPFDDMTNEELIQYSPELIYFTSDNISIDIKR